MIILPSLEIVPAKYNGSTLLSQIPIDGTGDFAVSRTTSPVTSQSTRVNALGQIELVVDNVPRLDYPLGGAVNGCPALLVEPAATNLCLQSENFGTTWSRTRINAFGSGSVLNTTGTLDPYGTNLADYIQEDTTPSDTHRIGQSISITGGTTYTYTCFLKSAERFKAAVYVNHNSVERYGLFDTNAGTASANNATVSIENYGNGWYRCRMTFTAATSVSQLFQVFIADDSGNLGYNGTGTKGIYVFGAQVETGSVPTSYIPTTTAAVTRSADSITRTGATALIGQSEGTIYWDIPLVNGVLTGTGNPQFGVRNAAFTNWIGLTSNGFANPFRIIVRATTGSLIDYQANITSAKAAVGWSSAGATLYVNGVQVATSETNPNFSFDRIDVIGLMTFKANAFGLYPTRLTDTQLALLTSPYTSYSSMASALSYTLG